MTLSKKELEDVKISPRIRGVGNFLVRLLRPVARLKFVARFLDRTESGRVGLISRYATRGDHDRAADIAIELLEETRHQPAGTWTASGRDLWWIYMYFAIRSLEETGDREKRDKVIEMARQGVEPFTGYYVAQSFLAFSRWTYRDGDHDGAVEFAETAAAADDTWAEPEFVLGWYRLILGRGDPLPHFTRAVQIEPKILSRIAEDPHCQKHPEMIEKLRESAAGNIEAP